MNNPIIYQVVGGLLILFFFYLIYMFTKTWRWLHVTTMFFVFAGVICLTVFSAMTIRTHEAWKSLVVRQRAEVKRLTDEQAVLTDGDLTQPIHSDPSYRDLIAQLNRVLLDRGGRVWRNCVPAPPNAGTVTVRTTPTSPPPAAEDADDTAGDAAAAAAVPNQIAAGLIVYAFQESEAPAEFGLAEGAKVPVAYLGEFSVTAATDTTATLSPTLPLAPSQIERMGAGGTWSLYETMPVDGHQYFSTDPFGEPDWSRPADEVGVFGEMNRESIEQVFLPHRATLGDQYDEVIERYLRDGMSATEADAPEDQWVKVRFIEPHEVAVDSTEVLNPVGGEGFFDQGRAGLPALKLGETAKFEPNDIAVFLRDSEFQKLLDEGKIDPQTIEPIYARPLNNYESSFRTLQRFLEQLARDIRQANRDNQALTESNERVEQQIADREAEGEKLREDLAHFEQEVAQISQIQQAFESEWSAKRADLSRIYRENHQLMAEARRLEMELTRRLDAQAETSLHAR